MKSIISLHLLNVLLFVKSEYLVYWNVPSAQCHHHGVYFNLSQFNIIQNKEESFAGETININYHPGRFPYLSNGEEINGGIPQKADFDAHVNDFREQVLNMPVDFKGVAILDFESYYPSYSQSKLEYKQASQAWVRSQHPDWTDDEILTEAQVSFNDSAKVLFEDLLIIGKEMRPNAFWGHYAYPYCHNYDAETSGECKAGALSVNDRIPWLFEESDVLYPSIYLYKLDGSSEESRTGFVTARIEEAVRVKENLNLDIPIYPYVWYRYHDEDSYLGVPDLKNSFEVSKSKGSSGAVIWGSSNDVNSKERCQNLHTYIYETLGPLVYKLTQE